jgi:hypothetical protein
MTAMIAQTGKSSYLDNQNTRIVFSYFLSIADSSIMLVLYKQAIYGKDGIQYDHYSQRGWDDY